MCYLLKLGYRIYSLKQLGVYIFLSDSVRLGKLEYRIINKLQTIVGWKYPKRIYWQVLGKE